MTRRSIFDRARLLRVFLAPSLMSGCGVELPTEFEQDDRTLRVWGYVMSGGIPAQGGAGLLDPTGALVATTPVELGKYLIGVKLPLGTPVCDGYRMRVAIQVGRSSAFEERLLEPATGGCTIPARGGVEHTLDFFFLDEADTTSGGVP